MKRAFLFLAYCAIGASLGFLAAAFIGCAPLRTFADIERVYGPPTQTDMLAHHYIRGLFPDGSGFEEFAFDSLNRVAWHQTAPSNIPPMPHF